MTQILQQDTVIIAVLCDAHWSCLLVCCYLIFVLEVGYRTMTVLSLVKNSIVSIDIANCAYIDTWGNNNWTYTYAY